jgi:ubiquinone/menaquinone biosynthesis C-methylase UbiE
MSDIDLYKKTADKYEELQEKRPDYVLARKAFQDLFDIHFKGRSQITLADFCCGTGNNTHLISQRTLIKKATLIDINQEFLDLAKNSDIQALEIETVKSDILRVKLKAEYDLVISMFAYHHVPDSDKERYIEIAKDALKDGGVLLLGEIFMPDKETTVRYYKELLDSIPAHIRTPQLETFLMQTAQSDDFEYKVSKQFAHSQLLKAGFVLLDSFKIWPKDNSQAEDVGTFVEAWLKDK